MKKFIHILFNNDGPELAYTDEKAAEAEAAKRRKAAKEAEGSASFVSSMYPPSYWHVHSVPMAEEEK